MIFGLGACAVQRQPATAKPTNPVAAYYDRCQDIMRPIWSQETRKAADLLGLGEAVLRLDIPTTGGHAKNVKVASNTGPEALAEIAVAVVTKPTFPPMPSDVAAVLNYQPFHVEFTFTVQR